MQETVKVSDADIEAYYNAHKSDYETVKARHILIRVKGAPMQQPAGKPELTDEEALAKAKSIREKLLAGEDFATVAKVESDDTGSAAKGGDLGEFKKGMMVPPFEQAAFAAKVGEITEPVKSPFGYHIIKVESHTTKPLAEVKQEIEAKLKPEMARMAVQALQKDADVKLDDAFFGPAIPAGLPSGHPSVSAPAAPARQ
jgi:parvulin-like peptidyl-prolyl isomerase